MFHHLAGALRRGQQGSILEKYRGQQAGLRIPHRDAGSYKPSVWGHSSDTQGQAVQSCPHCCFLAGSCFAPAPLLPTMAVAADHGGVPAVVAAVAAFPQAPSLLLSFMPRLIHSLALAGCCSWALSLARTPCGSLFLAGCACVWGRGNREEPSFWRGRLFVSF